ncbi:hypothetical protein AB0J72_34715 [Dactylosporangium sp. NPDC049742]|uniref:hypothetical protein n=1 Tax=Dactylosporangium sp. NPDC049742 TaxID=3154737 RepID=UPI00342A2327
MFKSIFRRERAPLPFVTDVDRALDDHDLRAARERAVAGDRRAAADVIAAAGTDLERRGHRIAILGDAAEEQGRDRLDAWLAGRRRDPFNFVLHVRAVDFHCAKWCGSHTQMFELARTT